ncbi:PilZ domain-containing protein [Aliikangiella coralliicola]|uniref:PilZ domain-containing protein n=1 Tax=Aliikangiella coralliicola TaxID=2592383 RepID=A0A545U0A7_9GAMM|nr:PilZ domain-containing protein [Aliikangiella coralliicola]TQV82898.1 PilZ domain-containing protein [Aliikangiella coralliicola]
MSSVNLDYEEKRNFIRMFVDATVSITDPETGQTFEGDSKNLSGDGVMFTTNQDFKENQKLNVDIRSEQSKLSPLSAEFEVVRTKSIGNGRYEVAGRISRVR